MVLIDKPEVIILVLVFNNESQEADFPISPLVRKLILSEENGVGGKDDCNKGWIAQRGLVTRNGGWGILGECEATRFCDEFSCLIL